MSYDDTLPTDRDRARSLIGDTRDEELFTDEHIDAVLTARETLAAAVAYLAHELVVRFEQEPVRYTVAGLTEDFTGRLTTWRLLAAPYTASLSSESGSTSSPISFVSATYTGATETDEYGRSWWSR